MNWSRSHNVVHDVLVPNSFCQRVSQVVTGLYKPDPNSFLVNTLLDIDTLLLHTSFNTLLDIDILGKCWFILSKIGQTDLSESIIVSESVSKVSVISLVE